jgi:hypothetical protein
MATTGTLRRKSARTNFQTACLPAAWLYAKKKMESVIVLQDQWLQDGPFHGRGARGQFSSTAGCSSVMEVYIAADLSAETTSL